jgi:hypothetical protein
VFLCWVNWLTALTAQGGSVASARWGESQVRGHPAHSGSPPRTGQAMWHRRAPSSAIPPAGGRGLLRCVGKILAFWPHQSKLSRSFIFPRLQRSFWLADLLGWIRHLRSHITERPHKGSKGHFGEPEDKAWRSLRAQSWKKARSFDARTFSSYPSIYGSSLRTIAYPAR